LEASAVAAWAEIGEPVPAAAKEAIRSACYAFAAVIRGHRLLEQSRKGEITLTTAEREAVESRISASIKAKDAAIAKLGLDARLPEPDPMQQFWRLPVNEPERPMPTHSEGVDAATQPSQYDPSPGTGIDGPALPGAFAEQVNDQDPPRSAGTGGEGDGEIGAGSFDDRPELD
jgi:hypothetical protein